MPSPIHIWKIYVAVSPRKQIMQEVTTMEKNTKRRVLTIGEAARLIDGITEYRIRQMCKTGQLRSFKAGNKFLIAEDDLIEAVFGKSSVAVGGGET